jgi:DNA-binding Lrp family transcriptional regulator
MELDRLDRRIISELDRDARASNSKIARALRINKNVVNYRIRQLEARGIIRGYYAIIDTFRLGYFAYRTYVRLQNAGPQKQKEMMDFLVSEPSVWWAGTIQSQFSLAFLAWGRKQADIISLWSAFNSRFRESIGDVRVSIYHGLEQLSLPFAGGKTQPDSIGSDEPVSIDATDARLLKLIANDARAPLLSLSGKMRLTPAAVRYRLRQLERKKVIVAYRANVAMDRLGYSLYKADFNVRDMAVLKQMRQYALQSPGVFYIDKSIGWADFEMEVYASSAGEFYSFLEKFRARFASSIRGYSVFTYSKIDKMLYVPDDL